MGNFDNAGEDEGDSPYADPEDSEAIAKAKKTAIETGEYTYTERDVILYNLGIGTTESYHQKMGYTAVFRTESGGTQDIFPYVLRLHLTHRSLAHCNLSLKA